MVRPAQLVARAGPSIAASPRQMFLIQIPLLPIAILLVLYFGVLQHFWLFLFTVGPVAAVGILFVRWCWDRQDRRRAAVQSKYEVVE